MSLDILSEFEPPAAVNVLEEFEPPERPDVLSKFEAPSLEAKGPTSNVVANMGREFLGGAAGGVADIAGGAAGLGAELAMGTSERDLADYEKRVKELEAIPSV